MGRTNRVKHWPRHQIRVGLPRSQFTIFLSCLNKSPYATPLPKKLQPLFLLRKSKLAGCTIILVWPLHLPQNQTFQSWKQNCVRYIRGKFDRVPLHVYERCWLSNELVDDRPLRFCLSIFCFLSIFRCGSRQLLGILLTFEQIFCKQRAWITFLM